MTCERITTTLPRKRNAAFLPVLESRGLLRRFVEATAMTFRISIE
jgi:hypothetical protein